MRKIAVIGSGISGMAAAYLLHPGNHVTLYEKNNCLGGHARTKTVQHGARAIAVDTGFIVFNRVNYPELVAMFRHLDVETQKSDMSFAFTSRAQDFEWGAFSLNAVFAQRSNIFRPTFYAMIRDVLRFFRHAPTILNSAESITLGQFLARLNTGKDFAENFLLPLGAAIWSCPADKMLQFPAQTFVQFFENHGLLSLNGQHQWYTVSGGSERYIDTLRGSLGEVKLSTGVDKVWQEKEGIVLQCKGSQEIYDDVVFASHADETLSVLVDADAQEKEILGAFSYQRNVAYLHCDEKIMPKRRRCWASWNYTADSSHSLSVTYWMNRLQSIDSNYPLFLTLNPAQPIAQDKIFDVHEFSHPVFTNEAIAAQKHIGEIQGKRNIWFCGAYQRYGFHEDGLQSAVCVAQKMGAIIPWR